MSRFWPSPTSSSVPLTWPRVSDNVDLVSHTVCTQVRFESENIFLALTDKIVHRAGYGLLLLHKALINTFPGHCCWKIKLQNKPGASKDDNGAHATHPELFQEYVIEPGYGNGRAIYTSADGQYTILFTGGYWIVQSVNNR